MCGIVYNWRTDGRPAAKQTLKRYNAQKDRGDDGFGFIAISSTGKIDAYKRYQSESEARAGLSPLPHSHVLFHHRFPTSTINIAESAHPIEVRHDELKHAYYVVHNGVISNPQELRTRHLALGYRYQTEIETKYHASSGQVYSGATVFNDSEALAIELARTIEGKQPRVEARGSIAYVVLEVNRANRLVATYYGTNGGNPLTVSRANGLLVASEGGKAIPPDTCYRVDAKTGAESVMLLPMSSYIHYAAPYSYKGIGFHDKEEEDYAPAEPSYESLDDLDEYRSDLLEQKSIARMAGEDGELMDIEIELESVEAEISSRRHELMLSQ